MNPRRNELGRSGVCIHPLAILCPFSPASDIRSSVEQIAEEVSVPPAEVRTVLREHFGLPPSND